MKYADIVKFHGHDCPGLSIGYRMASSALEALAAEKAADEELVAIVENDACGVDALQCLSGCTFGKGNLLFRDYGKQVFTVYARSSGKGVRVAYHGRGLPDEIKDDRIAAAEWIRSAPQKSILSTRMVLISEPEPAQIVDSVVCDACNERVMTTRTRSESGKTLCIPCFETPSPGSPAGGVAAA